MVKVYEEAVTSNFVGTIIDIETTGGFYHSFLGSDSRRYSKHLPVIFGYITNEGLKILYVEKKEEIGQLIEKIIIVLPALKRPFYAFKCEFEKGVLFHSCGFSTNFNGELNCSTFEGKGYAVSLLGIDNYDDPFNNQGYNCMLAWEKGSTELAVKHNRSCLLKEKDILIKRGYRTPDEFTFVKLN